MPHDHMIFSVEECEKYSLIPDKNTVIMATCQNQIKIFLLSFLSVLVRSNPDKVEHFMVCINGGDKRCGSTELQDDKQKFLEEIRDLKWHGRDMPLTIIRAWSRIGHSQALEMAIPWVHTEYYTIMHDDVIVMKKDWAEKVSEILKLPKAATIQEPDISRITSSPVLGLDIGEIILNEKNFINMPHLQSSFLACKKAVISQTGARWTGYHFEKNFNLQKDINVQNFLQYYSKLRNNPDFPRISQEYQGISMDFGSWMNYAIRSNGFEQYLFGENQTIHFRKTSWGDPDHIKYRLFIYRKEIQQLEEELKLYPEYFALYEKYTKETV